MIPTRIELENLARQAGEILRSGFRQSIKISSKKDDIDLVTEMDGKSEAYLLSEITEKFPDHRIVTEESGVQGNDSPYAWYIDPLDGTVNYAHGIPIYSVSLAFAVNGTVEIGVVYDPSQDECFSAVRGHGATLNGTPLETSRLDDLNKALLVTGFPYDIWTNPVNNLDNYARFAVRTQGVRRLGSAALDLCYVAAGRFDGFWELRLKIWDIAAASLIAEEAGAKVTQIDGSGDYLVYIPSILAANPALHAQMLAVLKETD